MTYDTKSTKGTQALTQKDQLKIYYGFYFPFLSMMKWLSQGEEKENTKVGINYFQQREFSFEFQIAGQNEPIFTRYQCYTDWQDFKKTIVDKCPSRIEIGPVYNFLPTQRHNFSGEDKFKAIARELVFDLDLSDYDDVRICGKEGHICLKCWPLMVAAVKVLDSSLRLDFGFEKLLWVYSGRRGVHCWVSDQRAVDLNDIQRQSISNYFQIQKGQDEGYVKINSYALNHPMVQKALEILKPIWFNQILIEQRVLQDETLSKIIINNFADNKILQDQIKDICKETQMDSTYGGLDVNQVTWQKIEEAVESQISLNIIQKKTYNNHKLKNCLDLIILTFCYPRLDAAVTKSLNHLLKAPFSVHPKSGKISIPLDIQKVQNFNPEKCVTLIDLVEENLNGETKLKKEFESLEQHLKY